MFNKFEPWNYYQNAAQPDTFSLSNSENVVNDNDNSQVQYDGCHTKSDSYVQLNANNMHQSIHGKSDYASSSKGTNKQHNIHKNCDYAVQSNGIINQNIYKNSNDSQTSHYLHSNINIHKKDFPNYHQSSKLAQLLNNSSNTDSFQNKGSQHLNQNISNQKIRYFKSNITPNENQFQSNVQDIQSPNKNNADQKNNIKNCDESNVVPYNFQLDSTQFCNNLNKHENGLFNNNTSSECTEKNSANHNSALQKKTEETFRQQIWVKNIESLNASTISEISHSSVSEKPNQTDYLNKISGAKVLQKVAGGKSVIEKNSFQTATANISTVNLKDKPLQNTKYKNIFSSNVVPNAVANNVETMNSIMNVEAQGLVKTNSNAFKQINENQNELNLDKIPSRSNKIKSIVMNKTAKNLNVSNSISENMELSNLYPIVFNEEEENSDLSHTNKDIEQTDLTSSSLSLACKEFENTADNTVQMESANDLCHSFNKFQKRGDQRNYLISNKNNCNIKKNKKRNYSLRSTLSVNSSNEYPNKNSSNIICSLASNREKEIEQVLQNEKSSAISNNNIQSNNSENDKLYIDKELNKAKKSKVSKVSVQKQKDVRSSKKRMSTCEGKTKKGKKIARNLNINIKDKYLIKDDADVNLSNMEKSLRSYPKKNYKRLSNNSKIKQNLHNEAKNGTDVLNESKDYDDSNYNQARANTFHQTVHKTLTPADQNKSDCAQELIAEIQTRSNKRGRKKGRKPIYFRNSLIDRKKLDLLIKYVEGNTNFKSSVDCDMKNSEISCNDEDNSFGIENTNDGSNKNESISDGTSSNSENISVRPGDMKYESAFDVYNKKECLTETKINQSSNFKSATSVLQRGSPAMGMVQVFKKCINDKDDSGTNSEAEELHDICMLANFEDKTLFSEQRSDMDKGNSDTQVFDEKIRELKHLGSNKCIGCESMIPMDKFWLKVSTGELKCAECLISSDRRAKEKKMQWKLLRENEELKLENLTLKHKIRKWIESKTIKNRKISDCHDSDRLGISSIPSENLEKENKNYKSKVKRGRRKFMEIGAELENELSTKGSKNWHNTKACIKSKKRGRASLFKKHI